MAQKNNDELKKALEEKISECKKALELHASMSNDKLQTIDMKLKSLESRFSNWKKEGGELGDSDYEQYLDLHEQFEAGQQRELLFLITLIQIDEYWFNEENKANENNKSKKKSICSSISSKEGSKNSKEAEKCLCLRFVGELQKRLTEWSDKPMMEPVTQYMKTMGVIENYEFKLLAITPDDANFSIKVQEEINLLNVHMNDFLFSSTAIDKKDMKKPDAEKCRCRGLNEPHFCHMTSEHANKFKLNSIICSIILNRLDCDQPGSNDGKESAIGNEAEIIDSDLNIGDRRPKEIQNIENQPFPKPSDVLEHPDDPDDEDENVSGVPIHEDTLNENKEKAAKADNTICNVCKKFKTKKTSQTKVTDEFSEELMKQRTKEMYFEKNRGETKLKSYDDINEAGLIIFRSLTDKLILLKWEILDNKDILGYEITVEDFAKVLKSPSKGLAIIKTDIVNSDSSIFLRCIKK